MSNDIFEIQQPSQPGINGQEIFTGGKAIQQVRSSYATAIAVQKPRELVTVERSLVQEANLAGESFYYGWGAGKDRIEGPSVKLACAAARCWGNCALEFLPVQDLPDSWIFTALFVDLETGFTMPRQLRQSKGWKVYGKHDEERKSDIRFQIGQSKAVRNVVLNALPSWLIDHAMGAAKAGVRQKIEIFIKKNGKAKAIEVLFKSLAKFSVKEETVLAKLGVAKIEALDLDDLVILRGDLSALESGEVFASELFPEKKEAPKPEGSKVEELAKRFVGVESEKKPEKEMAPELDKQSSSSDPWF